MLTSLFALSVHGENTVSLLTCERHIIVRMIYLFLRKMLFAFTEEIIGNKKMKAVNNFAGFRFELIPAFNKIYYVFLFCLENKWTIMGKKVFYFSPQAT